MKRLLTHSLRFAVTIMMVTLAIVVGVSLWDYYLNAPWTRDGRVRADVIAIAPDVSGLVTEVFIKDNQNVRRGDVLFRIDAERFTLALRQAEAVVAGKEAVAEQTGADYRRYSELSDTAVVSEQMFEMAKASAEEAKAAYDQALSDRDVAKLNLARSEVRASVNGRVTNVDLRPGAYVTVGRGVMALIDEDTIRVEGYFEETKLPRIHVGDKATIRLAGESSVLSGHVESIAGGIEDRERTSGSNLLADVNPTFSWVRLAQRVPVRVALDGSSRSVDLVSGRTATVEIESSQQFPRKWFW
ncbi:HlyD family secretion protein [Mesorhizobium sp. B3-1-7]|uniref:efflux RND transporter periplasmic adaptor subunit n=1 Tax=Mesorhizobium sp. B3-1-7 TaxID=2589894 RepID=UPI001126ECF4|nr:HlyD family secretion protein [Mesorhizobium sp. B3-1-7]TPI44937.1 HlyD family secretion protein [Mesorhizobium sp. B3-1-7]